jgi:hypothetical protein
LFAIIMLTTFPRCGDAADDNAGELLAFIQEFHSRYPRSQIQDLYKTLYQDAFGPGHIITSWERVKTGIEHEIEQMTESDDGGLTERCGPSGRMLRINLRSALSQGYEVEDIVIMMRESVDRLQPDTLAFLKQWDEARKLGEAGVLPWTPSEIEALDATLGPSGLQVMHHSEIYVKNYAPAYRIVLTDVFNEAHGR